MTCFLNTCNIFLIYFSVRFHKIVSHIQVVLCISRVTFSWKHFTWKSCENVFHSNEKKSEVQ